MDAPTIQQALAATPESLWHFLMQLPATMEAQIFYALVLGSLLGMLGHYLKLWGEGEIAGSLIDYLFKNNLRRSLMALFGVLTWSAGEVAAGLFMTDAGVFVGWALVILSGIKTGYAGDSIVNKAPRPVWTKAKRAKQ